MKQRTTRSRVDNRRSQPAEVADGSLDDIDAFNVRIGEQFLVHVLAKDADPDSIQPSLVRKASIGLRGQAANAESRQFVLGIVAGDDLEHAGGVLHGAAKWPYSSIQRRADHSLPADQFLRRRESHKTVVLGRVMYGSAGFLSNRARHQVCGD